MGMGIQGILPLTRQTYGFMSITFPRPTNR
ncbi:hypothetical protein LINGRAHAP2_LOCUS20249 [Linum grandiflorum]